MAEKDASVLPRRAVLVVGSHRSGTSALARVLSLLGCDLPKRVMPPLPGSNELGFWEPEAVVQAHEEFLAKIGSSWDDVAPLPDGAFVSAPALELRRQLSLLLQDEYGTSPLFVVKDPRISRLLPLWFAVLAELRVAPVTVIAVRNPLEVAASLKARDGFMTTRSLLLWLRHALDAEQYSRDRPRSIVMYDELLRDWQGVLAKLGADLDIKWPLKSYRASVEVENFLSEQHRHHVFDWNDLEGRADVVSWVKETYFALRSSNPVPVLEQIRDDLSRADAAFGPIIEEVRLAARMSDEQLLEASAGRNTLTAELDARSAALEARAAEVQQLQEETAALTNAVAASDERAAADRQETDRVRATRDAFASEIEVLAAEVERLAVAVKVAQSRAEAVEPEVAIAREELEEARTEVERLTAQANETASHIAALEAETTAERATLLTALEAARAEVEQEAAAANVNLAAVEAQAATQGRELLQRLEGTRAEVQRLSGRVRTAEEEATAARAERDSIGRELEIARSEAARLAAAAAVAESVEARVLVEQDRLEAELDASRTHAERLAAEVAERERELRGLRRLLDVLRSVTGRRNQRRRSLSHLGTWLLRPTPRRLGYLRRYFFLRWSGEFDVDSYLLRNPDVLEAGLNPLMHYIEYGRSEGRQPVLGDQQRLSLNPAGPDPLAAAIDDPLLADEEVAAPPFLRLAADPGPERLGLREKSAEPGTSSRNTVLTDELREALEAEFDRDYYLGVHEDIERSEIDPLEHYFSTGWREDRDPSAQFSTSYYLSSNPEVAAEDLNPLVHYVLSGRREGRRPFPPTGFKRQTLARLRSLDEEIAHWQHGLAAQSKPVNGASLAGRLGTCIGTRHHVVLSCSHDNYTEIVGGVQLCVVLEQAAFAERDCAYINLHPVRPLPVLSRETEPEALTLAVLCDGEEVGTATADAVIAALESVACNQGVDFGLVVHALHGHSPEVIAELHTRLKPRWAWLWLHDYFGICPSATLLRNKIDPCSAPPPDSPGCSICVFGEERRRHLPRFRLLLERVPFKLVAPSQFMAERWKLYFGNDQLEISVQENGMLSQRRPERIHVGSSGAPAESPVRVAFLGVPAVHKGWGVFLELVRRNVASSDYRFYHFGDGRYHAPEIERREVNVLESGRLGMVNALRADSIDLAVLWSLWEESFSYTAYEALSGGAAILTNKGSGNIARVVSASEEGIVFGDDQELFAAFEGESLLELVRSRRAEGPSLGDFVHSRMTADLASFDD